MDKLVINKDQAYARFEAKLPREQKEMFKRAAALSGYRTLTDFVLSIVREKAKQIIDENEAFLASERDKEIFFSALHKSDGPNEALIDAASSYKELTNESESKDSK